MDLHRRHFLEASAAAAALSLLPPAPAFAAGRTFTPEMFGARGDGRTDDSKAMAALAAAVNAAGGGTISFRRTTYRVGAQRRVEGDNPSYRYEPEPLLELKGCTAPLVIRGNGARLRCAEGLRYGVFAADGTPVRHPMPYIGPGLATPYRYMIIIENCSGPVSVSDIELDGNAEKLVVGGQYGDTGWQIPAIGLALVNNRGAELVDNVYSHRHGMDGLLVDGPDPAGPADRRFSKIICSHNGRQGCSITGGHGYRFERCAFLHTGRAGISSAPGAGVDIEAEGGKQIRDVAFQDCRFVDNAGCGLVADTGPSEGATFLRCTFVGSSNWAAWPNKPHFRFSECTFAGPLVRAFGGKDAEAAAQFHDCVFTDDPALSPTGRLYGGENPDRPLADLSDTPNMRFVRCRFDALNGATLPWSTDAIYQDCRMRQTSPKMSFPRGTFRGFTTIDGSANLGASRIEGQVVLNGARHGPVRP